MLIVFASVNISLTLFNLIPLYPLDGYQIVYTLLPSKQAVQFAKSAPYGPFIILVLFFFIPFLARLAGVGDFFLFQLAYYILQGSLHLIALVVGPFPNSFDLIQALYLSVSMRHMTITGTWLRVIVYRLGQVLQQLGFVAPLSTRG